jgi:RNA polymerase sigma-70 factor (ECF subfamily)
MPDMYGIASYFKTGLDQMNASATVRFPRLGVTAEHSQASELANLQIGEPPELPDELLLEQVSDGSSEALSLLFKKYARIVRGVAYKVLRDPSEADDLLQDIFLLVRRLCPNFDSSKGSGRFWILQMTYRRAISRRRYLTSRHFYTHLELDQAADRIGDVSTRGGRPPDPMNGILERKEALQSWFAELSESQRQTLHLFFFEGYTFEEIAAKLGQTIGNARNHYYRGLDKLRKQISAGKLPGKEAV